VVSLLGVADRFVVVRGTLKSPRATLDRGRSTRRSRRGLGHPRPESGGNQIVQRLTAFGSPCEMVLRRDASSDAQP
jgi:hypothetical protein